MIATPRSITKFPENLPGVDINKYINQKEYCIQVITPIFGGGIRAGEYDPVTPIRPSSIRGHLRFFWRSTCGAKFETTAQLFDREGEIWGTADSPSPVTIRVSQPNFDSLGQRKASESFGFQNKYGPESYVLFPARDKGFPLLKEGFSFKLNICWPKLEKLQGKIEDISLDVEAAVWAWTNFGGIGSRTRRGCGALFCQETAPRDVASIGKWYRDHLLDYGTGQQREQDWPTMPEKILIGSTVGKPIDQWAKVIDLMRAFRQGAGVGRNPGSSGGARMPGRSRWPEPEAIRRFSKSRLPRHQRLTGIPDNAFPRAEFGLPIVFHFKDGQKKDDRNADLLDPPGSELCPAGSMRMASPIILRPLAFGDGRRGVPLIMRLNTEPLLQVELKVRGRTIHVAGQEGIRNPELANYRGSPMQGFTAAGSALEAFVNFAKDNEFKEMGN
ncbi:MAG: type III-B CRISPR module RAMP protein Cmr1 [Methanothrix sp.]|nr:type III-B CRISPR module RAMP protein Cmr1 [Methanothrix sp.]